MESTGSRPSSRARGVAGVAASNDLAAEGLKVPQKQPKRGRSGSMAIVHRLRPGHPNHAWSYDFVEDRTHDGREVSAC